MGRRLWQTLAAVIFVLALGAVAQAQTTTTTTTSTTTTTAPPFLPTSDGYFFTTAVNLVLPSTAGEMIVYVDTRSADVTLTLPPANCGCKVGLSKITDDHLLHLVLRDPAHEGMVLPPFTRSTTYDLDKAGPPIVLVSNGASNTWFLGY